MTDAEIKEKCENMLKIYANYFNGHISFDALQTNFEIFENLIGLTNEEWKTDKEAYNNIQRAKPYLDAITNLVFLSSEISTSSKSFENKNIIFIRVFDNIIFSEQQILDAMEYNKLLSAIPKEAKAKIDKTLTTKKDVNKLKQDLVSFEFIFDNPSFEKSLKDRIEEATQQFEKQYYCMLIIECILDSYNNKVDFKTQLPYFNDTYKEACQKIKEFFKYGKRIKNFKEMDIYKWFYKYVNIKKFIQDKEYQAEIEQTKKELAKMIKNKEDANKMLEECIIRLSNKGRWYYD